MSSVGSSKQKKKQRTTCGDTQCQDRLSSLGDPVLSHILSFMPMEDAVRTTILSKRWDHIWSQVRRLCFNGRGPRPVIAKRLNRFADFMFHNVQFTIKEFKLDFALSKSSPEKMSEKEKVNVREIAAKVDSWIRYAIQRKAELVSLCLCPDFKGYSPPDEAHYKLPSCFFSNNSIKELRLDHCIIDHGKLFRWNFLRQITLCHIKLRDELMENILTGSPLLVYLHLQECSGPSKLSVRSTKFDLKLSLSGAKLIVTSPYLNKLEIDGDIAGLDLTNLEFVMHISLGMLWETDDEERKTCMERLIIGCVARAQYATFDTSSLQVISALALQNKNNILPLSYIGLRVHTDFNKWDLPGLVGLLGASRNLQTLVVGVEGNSDDYPEFDDDLAEKYDFDAENYLGTLSEPPLLTNLKTVKLYDFIFLPLETRLVEFLLKNANALQKIVIFCRKDFSEIESDDTLMFMQMLSSVRRVSPDAVVLFP